ncbi:MAG: redoxin domain-containing protein [Flavobacteriales bacterium]|jgi:peroxiredoxin
MKQLFFLGILLVFSNAAFSMESDSLQRPPVKGSMTVGGSMTAFKSGKLFLWESFGRNVIKLDSTLLTNGQFTFKEREMELGVYMIGMNENNMCPVILNPAEKSVDLQFTTAKLEASMTSQNSRENQGWTLYIQQEPALLKAIKDAKVGAAKNPDKKAEFEKQLALKEKELLDLQNKMMADFPGTQLAKLMRWKQEPNRTDIRKYWDNMDFGDVSITRSKVLSDRIESFMRLFSKGTDSGFYSCIEVVVERAKANDAVLEFALNQMLVGFYESNMETVCMYIIDNYINGDACGDADLSNVVKNTAESIQRLSLGHTPPNIQLNDANGQPVDLYALAAKKKYTLVLFWSSYCEHCKGEAPEVTACYNTWSKKGFEILGVSIDRSPDAWKAAIAERGFTFPNVCGMKDFQSPVAKDYRVTRTPAFFLLNPKGEIVLKPKSIREVQSYLAKNLK